jgi:Family of unknown function (DUF6640)
MTQALAGGGGRVLGRSLLTLANVITTAAPLAADRNDSHIFNERWPAHARFHGVTALAMSTTLSSANIWSVWTGDSDQARARFFAAAVPAAYWAPSSWPPWSPAPRSMIRRTGSSARQACRSACWVRRLPRRRRPLAGSSTAVPPVSEQDDPSGTTRRGQARHQ